MANPDQGTCNCPDPRHMHPNEVVQSKPACPVHDTPERLADLCKGAVVFTKPAELRKVAT